MTTTVGGPVEAALGHDSSRLQLATRKLRQNFDELRQAGLIEKADSRKLHSADDSRKAIKLAADDSLHRNDGPLVKAARMLLRLVR